MAGRTVETICNMALVYAGVNQRIGSINDKTPAAQICNTFYDEKRKVLQGQQRWSFMTKRKQLTPFSGNTFDVAHTYALGDLVQFGDNVYKSLLATNLGHQPDLDASAAWWFQVTRDGWAFACPLPDDFIDTVESWDKGSTPFPEDREPYAIENMNDGTDQMVFLTNLSKPILRYTADVQNPEAFPDDWVEALAWHLAVPLAIGLRGDEKKAATCAITAGRKESEAAVSDLRSRQEEEEPVSEFEMARGGG